MVEFPSAFLFSAVLDRCSLAYNVCALLQHPACSWRHFPPRCSPSHLFAAVSAGPPEIPSVFWSKNRVNSLLPLIHGYSILHTGALLTLSRSATKPPAFINYSSRVHQEDISWPAVLYWHFYGCDFVLPPALCVFYRPRLSAG